MNVLIKRFLIICSFLLLTVAWYACVNVEKKNPVISVTIQPQKYFAEKISNNIFDINCVVPEGSSPEVYDPSPSHLVNVEKSMAYFKVGHLGFELAWLDKLAQNNPEMIIYDNSKDITLINNDHVCEENTHIHSDTDFDPHIWSSPRQAAIMVRNMYDAFTALDPKHKKQYHQNYDILLNEIGKADSMLISLQPILAGKAFAIYHPSLSYLARDYGLEQLSIELNGKEPSANYMKQLIDLAREKDVKVVFVQKEFDRKNVETFARETGCKIIEINPLNYNWSEELFRLANILKNEYSSN